MSQKGQSLVEMAIITPILLVMLLGVFEVGYALRNYLVLINVSRETARWAARAEYLDFTQENVEDIGYDDLLEHMWAATSRQLKPEDVTLIFSNVTAIVGPPCDPALKEDPIIAGQGVDYWPNCDCELIATQPYTPHILIHPANNPLYTYKYPEDTLLESRIQYQQLAEQLAIKYNESNCRKVKASFMYYPQYTVVVAELFLEHHQLFGFPLISNPYTDPVTLHAMTVMRRIGGRLEDSYYGE